MSEGSQEGVYATPYVDPSEHTVNMVGTDYCSEITETDRVLTFTVLDDYDTLFAARHGRGALDPVPKIGVQKSTVTSGIPPTMAVPELINPMERMMPIHADAHPDQGEQVKPQIALPSSEIIGEGAAIFTDMMETILDVLDKQVAMSPGSQQPTKELSSKDDQKDIVQSMEPGVPTQKEDYPDLFLPIMENYRTSNHFHGYLDSLSADNNLMVLVIYLIDMGHQYMQLRGSMVLCMVSSV